MKQAIQLMRRIISSPLFWIVLICSSITYIEESSSFNAFLISNFATNVPALVLSGQYYRLLTSLFLHTGISHLISNMILLVVLTWIISPIIGKGLYLIVLFLSGIFGNLLADLFITFLNNSNGNYWEFLTTIGYSYGIVGFSTSITGLFTFTFLTFAFIGTKDVPKRIFRLVALTSVSFIGFLSVILGFIAGQWFTLTAYVHFGGGLVGGILGILYLYFSKRKLTSRSTPKAQT